MLFSQNQHFTCAQCGRCCRRTTVPVTESEAEAYRTLDPDFGAFEPIPGHEPLLRIRKRADGACVFLMEDGLCRIHKEMGFDRKPIACRLFPFSFHPPEGDVVVTASFACPTIVADEGAPLRSQTRELQVLYAGWMRDHPEGTAYVELVAGHRLPRQALTALRGFLTKIIDRPGLHGYPDLRENLRRVAVFLEDLSRGKVRRLAPDDFVEYLNVMGRHAVTNVRPADMRRSSRLARLLFRGFLLAALSVQEHLDVRQGQRGLGLRVRLLHLLAHLHGLAPGTARFNLRRATSLELRLEDDQVRDIAHRYLRTSFETAGAGRRPLIEEVALVVARLNAACVLAGMCAAAAGKRAIDGDSFTEGLLEAADLAHADDGGTLSRYLAPLSAGLEAFYLFPPTTT